MYELHILLYISIWENNYEISIWDKNIWVQWGRRHPPTPLSEFSVNDIRLLRPPLTPVEYMKRIPRTTNTWKSVPKNPRHLGIVFTVCKNVYIFLQCCQKVWPHYHCICSMLRRKSILSTKSVNFLKCYLINKRGKWATGHFMKKVLLATWVPRDR